MDDQRFPTENIETERLRLRPFRDDDAARAWTEGLAQWAIADRDSDLPLGGLELPSVSDRLGTAEIGYTPGPDGRRLDNVAWSLLPGELT